MEKMATLFDTPTFCIITGGSKGLGREIAIQLAQQWHNSGTYMHEGWIWACHAVICLFRRDCQ